MPNTDPFGITFAPDRNWWIAKFASHNLTILNTEREGAALSQAPRQLRAAPGVDRSGPNPVGIARNLQQVALIKGVKR